MTRTEGAGGGGTSAISTSAAAGGSVGAPAAAPAGIDIGVGDEEGGLEAAVASMASLARWSLQLGFDLVGLPHDSPCLLPPPPPAGGRLAWRPTNQHGPPQLRLKRLAPS
jgi:hypothetical protein